MILAPIQIPLKDSGSLRIALTILSAFQNERYLESNSFDCNQLHSGSDVKWFQIVDENKNTLPPMPYFAKPINVLDQWSLCGGIPELLLEEEPVLDSQP